MINFIEGKINIGAKNIHAASSNDEIIIFANDGLIERRVDGAGNYYYAEIIEDKVRIGIFIRLREKKIHWVVLRWLEGPCTSKGWNDVSEKTLMEEYRLLLNFVEKRVGRPPDNKKNRQRTWRFAWGQVDVSYESRDFVTQIFMKPK
jgi:hypothetical protein